MSLSEMVKSATAHQGTERRQVQNGRVCGVAGVKSDGMFVKGIYMNLGDLTVQVDDRNRWL